MRKSLLLISRFMVLLLVVFMSASVCFGLTNTWDGSESTDWFTAGNWSENVVPTNGQDVLVTNVATEILLTNSTANLATFTITGDDPAWQSLTFSNWNTTLNASNVTIQSFGKLTLPAAFTNNAMSNRVHIVCTNFTLASNGKIDVDEKGYAGGPSVVAGNGPGGGSINAGGVGAGAGYGGKGGDSYDTYPAAGGQAYGSTNAPVEPGSGGGGGSASGDGGNGGGAVRIEASGTVSVHGVITANGGNGANYAGGGSGGGIFITCGQLVGSTNGILRANGGTGNSGGGGGAGGRIAVIYNEAAQTNRPGVRFSTASGSSGSGYAGEIGTLYLTNTLFLTETLQDELFMNVLLYIPGFTNWAPGSLTISNCIVTFGEPAFQLNVTNDVILYSGGILTLLENSRLSSGSNIVIDSGSFTLTEHSRLDCGGNMTLTNGSSLYVYSGVTNAATTNYGAFVSVVGDVWIGPSSWIYPYCDSTNGSCVLFEMNNLTIATNGGFNANAQGYSGGMPYPSQSAGYGPGGGSINSWGNGAGAGYGGKGGDAADSHPASGGSTYGSTNAPVEPGSGGGGGSASGDGGNGGGAVRIEASGTVSVHGVITANGGNGANYGGGGSGGGIFITCGQLAGSTNGILRTNGGNGSTDAGGGGGGRIAVWYNVPQGERARILDGDMRRVSIITNASEYSEFSGTTSVTNGTGGGSGYPGDPGTIVFLTVTPPSGMMFMCQ